MSEVNKIGAERQGKVIRFTNCCTALKNGICYPSEKPPIKWKDEKRWHDALYVWADVENAYGHVTRMGLLVPVKVLDTVLLQMGYYRLYDENGSHWMVKDEMHNSYLARNLLLTALNRNRYDILWQSDDHNGRVVYEMKIKN